MRNVLMQRTQSGAALFVAMIFLLILSFLGGVLLSNSNQGLKIVSAMGTVWEQSMNWKVR